MPKRPGQPARGTRTGRPIMVLLDVLGQRWTLRILWELQQGRCTFRELRSRCGGPSPTILNRRLKELRELGLLDHDAPGYGLTEAGRELGEHLLALSAWSERWARTLAGRNARAVRAPVSGGR
ncbi:MAG TPA: helix-turn-helix domain-containing protein [Pseudomonadales bacterium]